MRFAFAAAIFGESSEALFWLQLPRAFNHLMNKLLNKSLQKAPVSASIPDLDETAMLSRITSKGKSVSGTRKKDALVCHIYCIKCRDFIQKFKFLSLYKLLYIDKFRCLLFLVNFMVKCFLHSKLCCI